MVKKLILMAAVCLILFTACDLFNPTDPDMLAKIDAEIAWANAARLNITVAYPQQWGTSLQRGTGRAGDTRVGYAFDIDFTPDPEYTFIEWYAFDTNVLNQNPNWMHHVTPRNVLRRLPQLDGIDLPDFGLGGGSGKITVNSDKVLNITLIPFSEELPRITRSTPDNNTSIYFSGNSIFITFAAPLDSDTVKFDWNHIRIWSVENNGEKIPIDGFEGSERRYADFGDEKDNSFYDNNTRTITIKPFIDLSGEHPQTGPNANTKIILELGEGITNSNGKSLKDVSIEWTTGGELISVTDGIAVCDDTGTNIDVSWNFVGRAVSAEVSWIINDSQHLTGYSELIHFGSASVPGKGEYRISNIDVFDFVNMNSLNCYSISITLFNENSEEFEMEIDPILVWNIPHSRTGAVTFINNEDELKNVSGNGMFVLMDNISVSNWMPLGRNSPFSGIFHGNNKILTVNGFEPIIANNQTFGIFGNTLNAEIHNLKVDYGNTEVNLTSAITSVTASAITGSKSINCIIEDCEIINGYTVRPLVPNNSASWTVDEQAQGEKSSISVSDPDKTHSIIASNFICRINAVNENAQQVLRDAIESSNVNRIIFDNVEPGETTITLATPLPQITTSVTIEGNGITLSGNSTGRLLYIRDSSAIVVNINRVHFTGGRVSNIGGAIYNGGNLTLESCIFSDNQTSNSTPNGSTIYNNRFIVIRGCTFFNNRNSGSAAREVIVSNSGATISLSGNLFYGNTGNGSDTDLRIIIGGDITSEGFNVVDVPLGTGSNQNGFDAHTNGTDKYITTVPISPYDAKLRTGGGAQNIITTLPAGYPTVDFYGNAITSGAAAGAVQAAPYTGSFIFEVNNFSDDPGSPMTTLRHAITFAEDGDTISFNVPQANIGTNASTITLQRPLPAINRNVIIEGKGITITRSWTDNASTAVSQLLCINTGADVKISRIHFKNGRTLGAAGNIANGGAIMNAGILTLESCIFSGNEVAGSGTNTRFGGAIYSEGAMTIKGCTFLNNRNSISGGQGGAIYNTKGKLTLIGNIFNGNRVSSAGNGHVLFCETSGAVNSLGYNVSDFYIHTDLSSNGSGFAVAPNRTDVRCGLSFNPESFKQFSFSPVRNIIPNPSELPGGYPTHDFYGNPIGINASPGAVQTVHEGTTIHTVSTAQQLRDLLGSGGNLQHGDTISINNTIFNLSSVLPEITKSIIIEGNGLTLTQSWGANTYNRNWQLMRIGNAVVKISRIHFREGRAADHGAAIYNAGGLTLESCIFSGNQIYEPNISAVGGAIYNIGLMIVKGCTFHANRAFSDSSDGAYGGAIYNWSSTLILKGNLFYGNTAQTSHAIIASVRDSSVISQGYNVVDRAFGTSSTQSGFVGVTGLDATFAGATPGGVGFSSNTTFPFDGDAATTTFTPRLGNSPANNTQLREHIPASWGHNIPAVDFYGNPRKWTLSQSGAPGAVEAP